MSFNKKSPGDSRPLSASVHADDGIDPKAFFKKSSEPKSDRKAMQLCSQVAKILNLVLAGDGNDPAMLELMIESVQPAPDSTRLLVTVRLARPVAMLRPDIVLAKLNRRRGFLRSQVAGAINRKRAPELSFRVIGPEEVST